MFYFPPWKWKEAYKQFMSFYGNEDQHIQLATGWFLPFLNQKNIFLALIYVFKIVLTSVLKKHNERHTFNYKH